MVEGVVVEDLDPADPWADKIADILSAADADMALADLATTEKNGHIAAEKAGQIRAAIQAKAATFAEVAA